MNYEYSIIIASDALRLETYVRNSILQGWKPLGGPTTTPSGNFMQGMIKEHS